MDVSPIKVANRPQPPVLTPAGAADTFHRSLANSGQYPPRHIPQMSQGRFTGPSSVAGGIQSVPARVHGGYHWRPHPGYPTHGGDNVSNPFYVIRSCQRAFAGCTYLLPCLREHMISVNLNRYGHIRRYDGNPEVRRLVACLSYLCVGRLHCYNAPSDACTLVDTIKEAGRRLHGARDGYSSRRNSHLRLWRESEPEEVLTYKLDFSLEGRPLREASVRTAVAEEIPSQ